MVNPVTPAQLRHVKQLGKNTIALDQMSGSMKGLSKEFQSVFNWVGRLTQVFQKSEQIQLQSLAAGTTYRQAFDRNTDALQDNLVSQQEMTSFLVGGFSRGLRDVSRSTADLADDMLLTGQNSEALIGVMGGLTLVTKDSNQAQSKLSTSILKNTKDYGVNALSMIQALNAVKSSLEQALIYGDDAVNSFSEAAVTLKAATAGAEGSDKAIATFLSMSKAMDIGVQTQLGIVGIMKDLRNGNKINLSEIVAASKDLDKRLGDGHLSREAMTAQYGEQNVQALLMLGRGITKGNALTDDMKANEEAKALTLAAQKAKVDDFYQTVAPKQYELVAQYLPEIAVGIAALPAVLGASRAIGGGLGVLGSVLGPIGIGLTALTVGVPLITNYLKGSERSSKEIAKNTKEIKKQGEKKKTSSSFEATTLSRAAVLASGLLRPGGSRRDRHAIEKLLQEQIEATNRATKAIKGLKNE